MFDAEPWLALRAQATPPLHVSELVTTEEDRREFLRGATMLRFFGSRAMRGREPKSQQLLVVDMLAAGQPRNAVLLPRRSSKSTTLIAIGLGRAEAREDYRVAILTMTTGKAGRSRFMKDVAPALERSGVDCKIVRAAGQERVEFPDSGGMVAWLSTMDDLRGEAFDMIILDESGEPDPQKVEDTLAAALPTLDTRPGAQIVVAGTAGKYRVGNLLWDWLVLGRAGRAAILEYAMPETAQDEELDDWETVEPLILAAHPGIGTLTTLDAVRGNWETLPRRVFAAEYGGLFGDEGGTVNLFDPLKWARTGLDGALPAPPERFSFAFASHPDGIAVSMVAAWRDDDGRAVPLLVDSVDGIDKAAPILLKFARKYRVPLVYDAGNQVNLLLVEKLNQANPRPKLEPRAFMEVKKAASLVVEEVDRENVRHWREQVLLNESIHRTMKRKSGDRGWLLGRDPKRPDDDVTPSEAWALAQLHFDTTRPKAKARGRVAA
ncbi:hypothetical protein MRBLWH7_000794 [Microbacterium sp. LWH7-1.2]|uniref:hypothetical protein n=1 Tax=Microbacterium sp. LWH7-1.2 TaxID=3135257 RepID=UPI003139E98A